MQASAAVLPALWPHEKSKSLLKCSSCSSNGFAIHLAPRVSVSALRIEHDAAVEEEGFVKEPHLQDDSEEDEEESVSSDGTGFPATAEEKDPRCDSVIYIARAVSAASDTTAALEECGAYELDHTKRELLLKEIPNWRRAVETFSWFHKQEGYVPATAHYNVIFKKLAAVRRLDLIWQLWEQMLQQNVAPDDFTYSVMIQSSAKQGINEALYYYNDMLERGIQPTELVLSAYINVMRKYGQWGAAAKSFWDFFAEGRIARKPRTYNMMMDVYLRNNMLDDAGKILNKMMESGVYMNDITQIRMIEMHSRAGRMQEAELVFAKMYRPRARAYNTLIHGYLHNEQSDQAMRTMEKMFDAGVAPTKKTYLLCGLIVDKGKRVKNISRRRIQGRFKSIFSESRTREVKRAPVPPEFQSQLMNRFEYPRERWTSWEED